MVCVLVHWDEDRLALIDQVIREQCGGVVQRCLAIRNFARVVQHAPWAVSPPDVGFRCP